MGCGTTKMKSLENPNLRRNRRKPPKQAEEAISQEEVRYEKDVFIEVESKTRSTVAYSDIDDIQDEGQRQQARDYWAKLTVEERIRSEDAKWEKSRQLFGKPPIGQLMANMSTYRLSNKKRQS